MTKQPLNQDHNNQHTDEAWVKLQNKLASEPVSPKWSVWSQQLSVDDMKDDDKTDPQIDQPQSADDNPTANRPSKRLRMNRRRKWGVAVAGAAIFAVILGTPVGNTAMASLLNQFRMEEVTVVNENDIRDIFYQVNESQSMNEAMNKFGVFTSSFGSNKGIIPLDQVEETLGFTLPSGTLLENVKSAYITNSQEITLKLNIEAVNKAMKRLGAKQLLPEAIDGKEIKLDLSEIVNYDLSMDNDKWANLTQTKTPLITVDPTIKVDEALEAIIDFPLLPDYLKSSLKQSRILSGEIPLPLVKGLNTDQIKIKDTTVLLNQNEYSQGIVYSAVWVQNGQLFDFNGGSVYTDKAVFLEKLGELIE
ncbi:DUF4179 domain-containing protein [Paenibacillus sp. FSL H7-0716]|uniref:DUF4179 domain-containing protein n=1 Tax=Paenibacillus odorifer TaxID=189426 RepID=A0AB36JGV1_9BACL|nr:DUF4179 domain-containing protein [Paenibacillus odorifer]OME12548.1 hypothetical protein BSK60_17625 [Paenibacillus odorifer]OME20212.1 hypothetical protein BSK47_13950 [Paenibacillus odorifer]